MERIVNAEHLYSNIKELLEEQRDIDDVRKNAKKMKADIE